MTDTVNNVISHCFVVQCFCGVKTDHKLMQKTCYHTYMGNKSYQVDWRNNFGFPKSPKYSLARILCYIRSCEHWEEESISFESKNQN